MANNLFSTRTTWIYLIGIGIAAIIIAYLVYNCNVQGKLCFAGLEQPCLLFSGCLLRLLFTLLFLTAYFFAGSMVDYYSQIRGKSEQFLATVRFMWVVILVMIICYYVLLFTAVNLLGAMFASFALLVMMGAYWYVGSASAGAASWVIVVCFIFVLLMLAYVVWLYNNNCDAECVRNSIFYC